MTAWRQGEEVPETIWRIRQDEGDEYVGSMVTEEVAELVTYLLNVWSSSSFQVLQADEIAEGFQRFHDQQR